LAFLSDKGGRREFLRRFAGGTAVAGASMAIPARARVTRPPNIVLILADDLGYGDLNCYGSGIATPNIDLMSRQGVRFTHFTSASPVCSPSRASWLTGRYPTRTGVPRVLSPGDTWGLNDSEVTMAQMMKGAGYATACVGKWHLGSAPLYMPNNHGFDEFFGIPYSIDQGTRPLMFNQTVLEEPANLDTLTDRYTQYAVDFINRSRNNPFFLYMAHSFPHTPFAYSSRCSGRSFQGSYGDMVQDIDYSVGQVLQTLASTGIDSDTLVIFSSDHGPWFQGSPGGLRGRKGESWEGGVRVPFVTRYPAAIPAGVVCRNLATSLDVLPTVAAMTRAPLPGNPLDGVDIGSLLAGSQYDVPRDVFLYFNDVYLHAARVGSWKLHVGRWNSPPFTPPPPEGRLNVQITPELYDVVADPDESHDRSSRNQGVVADIQSRIAAALATF
jgi:arylsulfatase A